jgi:hypothetical protein
MDMMERMTASPLGAAVQRRLFTGDGRLENEPPDSAAEIPQTVVAAANQQSVPAGTNDLQEENKRLRRDLDDATAKIDALSSMMAAVNDNMLIQQAQQQNLAASQLRRPANDADDADDNDPDAKNDQKQEQRDKDDKEDDQTDDDQEDDDSDDQEDDDSDDQDDQGDKTGDHYQETVVSAIDLECHIGALQTLLWYREHNPELYRDTDRRRTVNGPTMYDHIERNNAGVIRALQEAISQPGPHIGQAFNRFTASVAAGSKINKYSITSLLLEAFCRSECESVAEDARGIVIDAVSRSRDLDAMLQEVVETGMFDREAGADDEIRLAELAGFQDFNPAAAAGQKRWLKLQEIFAAYFSKPGNRDSNEKKAERKWKEMKIYTVAEFIPLEKKAFRKYKQAGGDVSDASRIKTVKKKFSKEMKKAYKAHKKAEASAGRGDDTLEKKWNKFLKVFERVGKAVEDEESDSTGSTDGEDNSAGNSTQAAQRPAGPRRGNDDDCFEYFCLGTCTYGDRCRYGHKGGEANSRRSTIADKEDNCLQYIQYGSCKRQEKGKCPLKHDASKVKPRDKDDRPAPGALSSEQHSAIVKYSENKQLNAWEVSWETVKADGGLEKWFKSDDGQGTRRPKLFPVLKNDSWDNKGGSSSFLASMMAADKTEAAEAEDELYM